MHPTKRLLNASMWRGAKMGAVSLGLVGFVGGITVCVAYHLPFPPIAVTELGALLGGCLGALAGAAWCYPAGRSALKGSFGGSIVGLAPAGLFHGSVSITIWLACVLLACLIGYQSGCVPQTPPESNWKIR